MSEPDAETTEERPRQLSPLALQALSTIAAVPGKTVSALSDEVAAHFQWRGAPPPTRVLLSAVEQLVARGLVVKSNEGRHSDVFYATTDGAQHIQDDEEGA